MGSPRTAPPQLFELQTLMKRLDCDRKTLYASIQRGAALISERQGIENREIRQKITFTTRETIVSSVFVTRQTGCHPYGRQMTARYSCP